MADFGTDVSGYPDYDPLGTLVTGYVALCQRICRRLTNDRGAWSWALDECTNILSYLNETLTLERLSAMQGDILRESEREEEVESVVVSCTVSPLSSQGQLVTIHINGTTGTGPFQFVLNASQLTLSILKAG